MRICFQWLPTEKVEPGTDALNVVGDSHEVAIADYH